ASWWNAAMPGRFLPIRKSAEPRPSSRRCCECWTQRCSALGLGSSECLNFAHLREGDEGMSMTPPEGLFALEGRPTAQLIADQLREQIVQGVFRPGQQVNESVLSTQLRTSRGPLREALQRLAQEGLLVSHRNRGVFVLELSTADIKEIYAVREAVELAASNTLMDAGQDQIKDTCRVLKEII